MNGHETDLEMSPGPLGTTIFENKYIRIMGKLFNSGSGWNYGSKHDYKHFLGLYDPKFAHYSY